jgi:hypothetical protein
MSSNPSSTRRGYRRYALAAPAAALSGSLLLTGCGGSSGHHDAASQLAAIAAGASADPSGAAAAIAAAVASGGKAIDSVSGQLDVSKQCAMIPTADVQALLKGSPGSAANQPLQCSWSGTDLQISLSPMDSDKSDYNALVSSDGHAIAGLGDEAQWSQPVKGATIPNVDAHKGSLSCYVQAPDDITTTTLPYTGSDPFYTITDTDALAYATKEAKLCADLFAAAQ